MDQARQISGYIAQWLERPFKPEGDAVDWFLFFALAAIAVIFWSSIITRYIKE